MVFLILFVFSLSLYSQELPYKLNVVYFTPTDNPPLPNYEDRISRILFHGQNFFKEQNELNGFGPVTFSLSLKPNSSLVRIIRIQGKREKSYYPYDGGGKKVKEEVDEFFENNPSLSQSHHTLVILPAQYYEADGEPANVPFYGYGTFAFALDYEQMDIKYFKQKTIWGSRATKWIGGLMHELGHGLNLIHVEQKPKEYKTRGTSLMGSGNYTYGNEPTFLTKSSSILLVHGQLFSKEKREDFYEIVDVQFPKLEYKTKDGYFLIRGEIECKFDPKYIIVKLDPAEGSNYDSIDFPAKMREKKFSLKIPISELRTQNGNYQIQIIIPFENGYVYTSNIPYQFN